MPVRDLKYICTYVLKSKNTTNFSCLLGEKRRKASFDQILCALSNRYFLSRQHRQYAHQCEANLVENGLLSFICAGPVLEKSTVSKVRATSQRKMQIVIILLAALNINLSDGYVGIGINTLLIVFKLC